MVYSDITLRRFEYRLIFLDHAVPFFNILFLTVWYMEVQGGHVLDQVNMSSLGLFIRNLVFVTFHVQAGKIRE